MDPLTRSCAPEIQGLVMSTPVFFLSQAEPLIGWRLFRELVVFASALVRWELDREGKLEQSFSNFAVQ